MNTNFTILEEEQYELCEEYIHRRCQGNQDSNEQEGENNNSEVCERIEFNS